MQSHCDARTVSCMQADCRVVSKQGNPDVYAWLVIGCDEWCEVDAKKDGCGGETGESKLLRVESEKNLAFLLGILAF